MVRFWKDFASRLLLVGVALCFFGVLSAQEGIYTINWLPNRIDKFQLDDTEIQREYLNFEEAFFNYQLSIPQYRKSISLAHNSPNSIGFKITELKYETIPDSMMKAVEDVVIPPSQNRVKIYRSGDRKIVDVMVDAIRENPQRGTIERLISFEIQKAQHADNTRSKQKSALVEIENSRLSSGSWYKFMVNKTGIYSLNYNDLAALGFSNPQNISVYGNGGKQLSYFNGDPRPSDLVEIPVYKNKGADGTFGEGDRILFYLEGPVTWEMDTITGRLIHDRHNYSDNIYYYLTTSQGSAKEISIQESTVPTPNVEVNSYSACAFYELDKYNLIGSGRNWFSKRFDENQFDTTFTFQNVKIGAPITFDASVAARSRKDRYAYMLIDGEQKTFVKIGLAKSVAGYNYQQYAVEGNMTYTMNASSDRVNVGLEYNQYELADEAYVDYITVNARCALRRVGDAFFFRDMNSVTVGNTARFTIGNAAAGMQVWDVNDINNVHAMNGQLSGSNYVFSATAESLREYVLLDPNMSYPQPIIDPSLRGVGMITNQNLRGIDLVNYLIISHEAFLNQANRLADWHRENSGLSVAVVTPEQIYNEFSAGTPDVSAMRDFVRQHYNKSNANDGLKYLLLFGDGSYNNHSYVEGNTNYILTYQSINSLLPTDSYSADDFFGLLDEDEGGVKEDTDLVGKLDVGIGRIPVREINGSDYQAEQVVDKIIRYGENDLYDWRRTLCFIGDDGKDSGGGSDDGDLHMRHADHMAGIVREKYKGFEYKKIYLDAYQQVSTSTGAFYPEAKDELLNTLNKGALVTTYFGHGSENQITSERVLQKADVIALKNEFLTLFVTATCSFSRYDDVEINVELNSISAKTSAGEEAFLNPEGGAIAMLTTSRVVYSSGNFQLASQVFSNIFDKDGKGRPLRLGDIFRKSKNALPDQTNKLNFVLLGDPALRLAFPEFKVLTDSINNVSIVEQLDTLKAFSKVTISGYVAYDDSTIITDFNGLVYPHVYDKEFEVTTLGNEDSDIFKYSDQNNLIFKGKATVKDGRFRFSFVVPKDISYNLGIGKISYYAENGTIDARGECREVLVGGTDNSVDIDYEGPEISLYMNDDKFEDYGITDNNPYLYARLSDENGINTTGNGIGHDMVATLNFDSKKTYMLNEYYETDANKYTSGSVRYRIFDLEPGEHTLGLKAWDVFNNSSEAYVNFTVTNGEGLIVEKLINYPNPANANTTFQYSHNSPGEHELTLDVFDLSGRLVTSISRTLEETGFISEPLSWDLENGTGSKLSNGIYPYRLTVKTEQGASIISEKLIIFR